MISSYARRKYASSLRISKNLNANALIGQVNQYFKEKVPDHRIQPQIPLEDVLMSAFAMFSLKDPSLLAFERRRRENNLKHIYGLTQVPSDTAMRQILDDVDPERLYPLLPKLQAKLQRGKGLEDMAFYEGHYLISNDGTGYFSSEAIHCDQCLVKNSSSGKVSYAHQFLGSCLVHPDHKVVIPLSPEPIQKSDGQEKNDCERNASKRLLKRFRREHPHMKAIIVEDALAANAPHIKELKKHDLRYIIGAKPQGNAFLFSQAKEAAGTELTVTDESGVIHRFRFVNNLPLNESNQDARVNFIEYWEESAKATRQKGAVTAVKHFTWITDILVTHDNVFTLMRGGRARWKIENETFNTLKNQGYQFEHNFGHGKNNLSTIFVLIMMLAFLVDQILQKMCKLFQAAWEASGTKRDLWAGIRSCYNLMHIDSMNQILTIIAGKLKVQAPSIDDTG